jgi:hypothetical protein
LLRELTWGDYQVAPVPQRSLGVNRDLRARTFCDHNDGSTPKADNRQSLALASPASWSSPHHSGG